MYSMWSFHFSFVVHFFSVLARAHGVPFITSKSFDVFRFHSLVSEMLVTTQANRSPTRTLEKHIFIIIQDGSTLEELHVKDGDNLVAEQDVGLR